MTVVNRVLAVVMAFALLIVGLLVPIEIVRAAFGRPPWLLPWPAVADWARQHTWDDIGVRAVLLTIAALGLLLLGSQLVPRRPGAVALAPGADGVTTMTTRRSLQNVLSGTAVEVPGVTAASTKLRKRDVTVTATTRLRDPGDLVARVSEKVTRQLQQLQLAEPPRVAVRLNQRER